MPGGFVFAVKASRFMTHMKRLKEPDVHLRRFLERARHLGPTLGPVLFQLPHSFHANLERLDGLLRAIRRQRLIRGMRVALEVRHASWLTAEVFARLREARVALCLHDSRQQAVTGPLTADFVYVRRHGLARRRGNDYPERMLRQDARRIRQWLGDGRDVYVYFNNDESAFAVKNARRLRELLGDLRPRASGPPAGRPARAVRSRPPRAEAA